MSELLEDRPAAAINLIGGRLCFDFVNSVGARHIGQGGAITIRDEMLSEYFDLLAWTRHAGALSPAQAAVLVETASRRPRDAARIFRESIRLREGLYRILRSAIAK